MNKYELYHHGVKGQKWGIRRYQNADGSLTSSGKARYNDDYKYRSNSDVGNSSTSTKSHGLSDNQKTALKVGAAIVGTALVVYGAHKLLNDPKTIEIGKSAFEKISESKNTIKSTVESSTEYKIATSVRKNAKTVGKGVKTVTEKVANTLGNDKFGKAVSGVGTMAVTTSALRTQIKELKDIKNSDGDAFDKSVNTVKKISDIGTNVNSLAKGPMGQTTSTNVNNKSKSSTNELLVKTRDLKSVVGEPKGIIGADAEKSYQQLFKKDPTDDQRALIKAMRKNGYSVDQIEQYVFHSGIEDFNFTDFWSCMGENYIGAYLGGFI